MPPQFHYKSVTESAGKLSFPPPEFSDIRRSAPTAIHPGQGKPCLSIKTCYPVL
jgi:hypothetical protein